MPGPNLQPARDALDRLMEDTCVIVRDQDGTGNLVLNEATGALEPTYDDEAVVYGPATRGDGGRELGGRCMLVPGGLQRREDSAGGQDLDVKVYTLTIPWDAPMPQYGDTVLILSSRRDPEMVGQQLRLRGNPDVSTFLVSRQLDVERVVAVV